MKIGKGLASAAAFIGATVIFAIKGDSDFGEIMLFSAITIGLLS